MPTFPRCGRRCVNVNSGAWHKSTDISAPANASRKAPRGWPPTPRAEAPEDWLPWENLFREVGVSGSTGTQERRGWHHLDVRLAGDDALVVLATDRIGRTWQVTIRSICSLRDRRVRIRSLAEAQWTRYLEAEPGSPEAFFGQVLTMFAAWVADQDLASIKRRTRDGLERARQQGRALGPPLKVGPGQLAAMRLMRKEAPASGGSPALSSAHPARS